MVSQDVMNELHDQLLAERQRLEREIANLRGEGVRADVFQDDETDSVDQHPADDGSELFEREKNLTVERTLEITLEDVNQALHRFDEGTYGQCDNCGKPIGEKRLRAMPSASFCIDCQSKLERHAAATS